MKIHYLALPFLLFLWMPLSQAKPASEWSLLDTESDTGNKVYINLSLVSRRGDIIAFPMRGILKQPTESGMAGIQLDIITNCRTGETKTTKMTTLNKQGRVISEEKDETPAPPGTPSYITAQVLCRQR